MRTRQRVKTRRSRILMHLGQAIEAYASLRHQGTSSQMGIERRCASVDRSDCTITQRREGARKPARRRMDTPPGYEGVVRASSTGDARAAIRPYKVPALAGTHAGDACGTTKARSTGTMFSSVPGQLFAGAAVSCWRQRGQPSRERSWPVSASDARPAIDARHGARQSAST